MATVSRKWSLLKRDCPLCRAPRWIITDPHGMQRGCFGRWNVAAAALRRKSAA